MSRADRVRVELETQTNTIYETLTYFKDMFDDTFLREEESRRQYAKKIHNLGFLFTAYDEEKIRGFICGYLNQEIKQVYISFLAVDQNIGAFKGVVLLELYNTVVDFGTEHGMESVKIEVKEDNTSVVKLYKKLGLSVLGKAKENTIYMGQERDKLRFRSGKES
ncbi:MAG: GNAT family N-acetyltransferase [Suipraeoptans sp.]